MDRKEKDIKIINIQCVLAMILVALPLLILGHFNYPSADDWSFGGTTYKTIEEGGNVLNVLKAAFDVVIVWREKGEPRYANAFLGALQPGIWGEHFYRITPWLMIGSLIFSEILLCGYFLRENDGRNKKIILPVIIPSLLLQILCVPYPVETFYWYTGAVNYTFIFALSLIQLVIFLKLKRGEINKKKTMLLLLLGCILSVFVGGDSYAASLSTVCIYAAGSFAMLICDRKALLRTMPLTLVTIMGLILCLVAPGNQVRLDTEFGGTTTGASYAIIMSLKRSALNMYSWTDLKIIIMLILIAPFLWKALKSVTCKFKYPVVFTVFTFGIYASQIVATMYVDGSTGGRRMADILYYGYHVWMLLNEGYWIGWLQRRGFTEIFPVLTGIKKWFDQRLLPWFCTGCIILAGTIGLMELKTLSTYRACAWLLKGYAKDYAQAWEERLIVLKDDSIKEVYFDPLPGYEELIFYTDLQYGDNWVNRACAEYYDKEYVGLK